MASRARCEDESIGVTVMVDMAVAMMVTMGARLRWATMSIGGVGRSWDIGY